MAEIRTRPHQRIFALGLAILFFIFSFGAIFAALWQLYKDNKGAKAVNDANTVQTDSSTNNKPKSQLQGTTLKDFTPVESVDKLQITDTKVGDGAEAKAGDQVVVDYTGAVAATGVIFQSSLDTGQPAPLSLKQVIKGWADGIPGMKVGGSRRLVIPADQAYGANPPSGSGIPANAPLVFDVTLRSIGQ